MSLKDELIKARSFDEKHAKRKFSDYNAIFSDPKQWASSIDWYDGARTMYSKDQKLFELLCEVALAADHPWLEELTCECGFYGDDTEDSGMSVCAKCAITTAISALRAHLAKDQA